MELIKYEDVVKSIPLLATILKQDLKDDKHIDYRTLFCAFKTEVDGLVGNEMSQKDLHHAILMEYDANV